MNDWRIGRLVRAEHIPFDATSPASYTLKHDMQRVGWEVWVSIDSAVPANWATISFHDAGQLLLSLNNPYFKCSLTTHGDLPTHEVTISSLLGALSGYLIVYTMPEKYLQAALQEFNSKYNF